jgi:Lon protease-like protein
VFPLGGALLFPRASLPLNIFEPRYLAMVDAALASHRMIGMIQPAAMFAPGGQLEDDRTPLAQVGCAGRITALQETDDNRYLIVLTGVARFRAGEELPSVGPYRMIRADWEPFANDLQPNVPLDDSARARLLGALKTYLRRGEFKADWGQVESAPFDALINSLAMGCPFTNGEKQALIEARTLDDRCAALITLLEMERPGQGGGYVQ